MIDAELAQRRRRSRFVSFGQRIHASFPGKRDIFLGALLWAVLMCMSALAGLLLRNGAQTANLSAILLLFFAGGFLSWPAALVLGRFCAQGRDIETRFAAYFLCLTVCTIAATALLFALDYRSFYARWHGPVGSRLWLYQFAFTSAGAVYQFLVMGLRLYLPLGFVALVATSMRLAWQHPIQQR
ncbi:hypothetical protein [Pararhizobium gei]|uniref:hypothetical protein n=1 Tax=Pararhizobium gei TaxID=1395951 RepID=UPI0023DAA86F|nr:hypothetical protein [Rhizobium gei]